jgi:hypothetical protein
MGLAIWITTPALLLLFWLKRDDKYILPLLLQALLIFIFVLTHGETGWKQFGMRFSLDFLIFLIIPIGSVFQRIKPIYSWSLLTLGLIVNFWGVILYHLNLFRFA